MALSITDLKKGTIFQLDGVPYRVVSYSQKVMGRGGSIVNVRIKSLIDGKVLERTFKGSEQVDSAEVSRRNVQYLYSDSGQHHFMGTDNYEQYALPKEAAEDLNKYIKEGENVVALLFEGKMIGIDMPKNVALKVTYAEDAVRGDTSSAITKEASLETGVKIKVPVFIKTGDMVSVDTSTGAYRERIKV